MAGLSLRMLAECHSYKACAPARRPPRNAFHTASERECTGERLRLGEGISCDRMNMRWPARVIHS